MDKNKEVVASIDEAVAEDEVVTGEVQGEPELEPVGSGEYPPETETSVLPDEPHLMRCTVERPFCDGGTRDRFEVLGYKVQWPAAEVRSITMDLYLACASSGARISIVPEGS